MIVGNTDNEDNVGNFQYPNPAAIYPGIPGVNGAPACERNSYAPEDEVFPLFYEFEAPSGINDGQYFTKLRPL